MKLVVFDNRRLGMVKLEQEQAGLPEFGTELDNPDFEAGEPGRPPAGWTLRDISAAQVFTARLTPASPAAGKLCLEISRDDFLAFGQYATVSQSVTAEALRGKRVRFTAKVRTSGLTGYTGSGLFARVHRPEFRPGHSTEMNDRPERGTEWVTRSVVVLADCDRSVTPPSAERRHGLGGHAGLVAEQEDERRPVVAKRHES